MGREFLSWAGKFLQEQKKHRRWTIVFICLAVCVTLGTLRFLKLYGEAMTHKMKVLDCKYEVHEHTDDCYAEDEDGELVPVCEHADEAEYVVHLHNDDCYDSKGELVCFLEEHELHEHTEDCYEEAEVLICEEEETDISTEIKDNEVQNSTEDLTEEPDVQSPEETETQEDQKTGDDKQLACEQEAHSHNDECYADGAGCEKEVHIHDDACYTTTEELACEQAEHTHDDNCYTEGESQLTCEAEEHGHDDGCYDEEGNLVCESEEHSHEEGCYTAGEAELTCSEEEHSHGADCYTTESELTCETEEHEHDDSCAASSELVCEMEEHEHDDNCYEQLTEEAAEQTAAAEEEPAKENEETKEEPSAPEEEKEGHIHSEQCYEIQNVLVCGELELHTHNADAGDEACCYEEDCFEEDGSLIDGSRPSCGILQLEEHFHSEELGCFKTVELSDEEIAAINGGATLHIHNDNCYDEEGNLVCGHEVTHLHQLDCYDEEGNLICGFEEEAEAHEHGAGCYDEEGNLTCGYEDAKDHEHDADCYDEEGNLICGYEGMKDHQHSGSCYDEEGNLICGYEGAKDHEHDAECYDIFGNLICGYEGAADHVHTEDCYDEEGNLICGHEDVEVYDESKSFECDDFIVVARYNQDAQIPEEARLVAEQITADSDQEHYANRESEYRKEVNDETASMRALLKIGFYIEDGEELQEIEPETPVTLVIQFLDSDGLAEDKPITVIHFGEAGTEKLDGGRARDNSTSFKMDSFSEIAIGYGPEEPEEIIEAEDGTRRLHLSDSYEYEDDAFQIVFHIEGDAIVPEGFGTVGAEAGKKAGESDAGEEGASNGIPTDDGSGAVTDTSVPEDEDNADAGENPAAEAGVSDGEDNADAEENPAAEAGVSDGEDNADAEENPAADAGVSDDENSGEAGESPAPDNKEDMEEKPGADETILPGEGNRGVPKLEFKVERVGKGSEEYRAFKDYAMETDGADTLLRLQVLSYTMTYGEAELDLSECEITAEISPSETLKEQMDRSMPEAAAYLVNHKEETIQVSIGSEKDPSEAPTAGDQAAGAEEGEDQTDDHTASDSESGSEDVIEPSDEGEADGDAVQNETDGAEEVPDEKNEEDVDSVSDGTESGESEEDADYFPEDAAQPVGIESIDEIKLLVSTMAEESAVPVDEAAADYSDDAEETPGEMSIKLTGASRFLAMRATGLPDPNFTVQYYANLDILDETGSNALPVIDTSGGGSYLPKNGGGLDSSPNGNPIRNIYVDNDGNVLSTKKPAEVYASREFRYKKAPSFNYINALVGNANYDLKEVWVLKDGGDAESVDREDWTVYPYSSDLHFTNRSVSAEGNRKYVLIQEGTVMRLLYDVTEATPDFEAAFYDYDISSGRLYGNADDARADGKNGGIIPTSSQTDSKIYYANTVKKGINSEGNYKESGAKLAFGNVNTGTTLGDESWNGNSPNKKNTASYKGCTFGLVTGLADGKLQYADKVDAPNLFDEGSATGKTSYDEGQYSLKFNRSGDTYTLTAVNGSGASGLESFEHPPKGGGGFYTSIWTNNFWPMDSSESHGTDGHDLRFGNRDYKMNRAYSGNNPDWDKFPECDDGKDHNSYFGMKYEVEFELSGDYVGPLEYYFFGDDDMWMFLDGKLACDIGGIHASVGEYVDLWDYLEKGVAGKHTLSFFYTERGASGSTCWMRFTLPTVSSITPETTDEDYGHLKIEKTVSQVSNGTETPVDNGDEFTFTINFTDANGNKLPDDYSYVKFDKDGNELGADLIIWDGGEFTLKNGEYVIVKYLPQGTKYTVTELNGAITVTDGTEGSGVPSKVEYFTDILVDGSIQSSDQEDGKDAVGDIPQSGMAEVNYNNKFRVFELPKTGGSGTTLYTLAGVLTLLFCAGFLYRQRFRERRAKDSL